MFFRVVLVMAAVFTVIQVNAAELDSVPPPPPGPYLSSGLSNVPAESSNREESNQQVVNGNRTSPLIRPDVSQRGNNTYPTMRPSERRRPESGAHYAPKMNSAPPIMNGMRPPMMNGQPNFTRPAANFSRPQFNQRPMYRQQAQPQMNQQPMHQQQAHKQMNRQQMYQQQNQQSPVWNNFHIPMSNYPRQNRRAQPPFSR